MKNSFILICLFLFNTMLLAQNNADVDGFMKLFEENEMLSKEDLLYDQIGLNFSELWLDAENNRLGFKGNNFSRLSLKFLMVQKNYNKTNCYFVYGQMKMDTLKYRLLGEIEILKIRKELDKDLKVKLNEAKEDGDKELFENLSCPAYQILGRYYLCQDEKLMNSGEFKGVFVSKYFVKNGKVLYNDLNLESDSYCNNQFVGTFREYKTPKEVVSNWGDYRIPYSGDLDIGSGEFSVNPIYLKNGWQNYMRAVFGNDINAKKEEEKKWWKN